MKALALILAIIAGISVWACGIGAAVSIAALVLKWCGVSFVAGMSNWVPLQFIAGYIVSAAVALLSTVVAAT